MSLEREKRELTRKIFEAAVEEAVANRLYAYKYLTTEELRAKLGPGLFRTVEKQLGRQRYYAQQMRGIYPGTITHNWKEQDMKETVYSIKQSDVPATNLKRFDQFGVGDFLATEDGKQIGVKVGSQHIRWMTPARDEYDRGQNSYAANRVCTTVPAGKFYRVPARVDISVTL